MKSIAIITNLPFTKYSKTQFYYKLKEQYEVLNLKDDVFSVTQAECVILLPDWTHTEHTVWLTYYATKVLNKSIVSRGLIRKSYRR